jgi:hypothetical protein
MKTWRSGLVDPHILDLDSSHRRVVNFTPLTAWYHWMGDWMCPIAGLDGIEK